MPVEIQLVMTDRTLLAGDATPAHVPGYGPVPAGWARDLVAGVPGVERSEATVWLRRLYTHPATGTLVGMDSTRRVFQGGLRRFARDPGQHLPDPVVRRAHPARRPRAGPRR